VKWPCKWGLRVNKSKHGFASSHASLRFHLYTAMSFQLIPSSHPASSLTALELAIQTPLPLSSSTIFISVEPDDTPRASILRNESSLAPIDGGFGAWSFIRNPECIERLSCFMLFTAPPVSGRFLRRDHRLGFPTCIRGLSGGISQGSLLRLTT